MVRNFYDKYLNCNKILWFQKIVLKELVAAFEFLEYARQEYVLKSLEMVTFIKSSPVSIITYVTVRYIFKER
jgi:hypothetical protein